MNDSRRLSGSTASGSAVSLAALLIVMTAFLPGPCVLADQYRATGTIEACFSPRGGCKDAIVKEIGSARSEILVQAYSFTSAPIAKALIDAHRRGVSIEVVLDRSQRTEKYSAADFLAHAGIPTYIDAEHTIAHNKIMIIDRATVITGSFNFTRAADEKNAENLLIMKDNRPLFERYIQNFQKHKGHSEKYEGR